MSIYTKAGDTGETGLGSGERLRKSSLRIEATGSLDELNSWMGLLVSEMEKNEYKEMLIKIQNNLHQILADLSRPAKEFQSVQEKDIQQMEAWINQLEKELPPLRHFILPGGSKLGSQLHISRTICRRAERRVVELADTEIVDKTALKYLNRLGDFLFVLARAINMIAHEREFEPDY